MENQKFQKIPPFLFKIEIAKLSLLKVKIKKTPLKISLNFTLPRLHLNSMS